MDFDEDPPDDRRDSDTKDPFLEDDSLPDMLLSSSSSRLGEFRDSPSLPLRREEFKLMLPLLLLPESEMSSLEIS